MIYLTGDTHGKPARLANQGMPYAKNWGKYDILIICGDFGYLMNNSTREDLFLRELSFIPYTICFVDGNRENFDMLNGYPVTTWCGGKVHRIRRNIIHLMRGQVYVIDHQRIFTMGGGSSIDRYRRDEGVDWWRDEMPNAQEYEEARANLESVNRNVDYVITHTMPTSTIQSVLASNEDECELNDFLQWVKDEVSYKNWFFGHVHMDAALDSNMYALFTSTRELSTAELIW